jgi:outer membrane protein
MSHHTPAFLVALLLASAAAHAQDEPTPRTSGGLIGLGVSSGYQYLGSDEHRTQAMPMLEYRWANGWFAGGRGLGYRVISSPGLEAGVGIGLDMGRKESRSAALTGLGDVSRRPELMSFARWQLGGGFSLDGDVRWGAGNDRNGLQLNVGAGYDIDIAPRWRLGTKVSATFANSSYLQDYFGISATQAARSGYAVHEAGAGLRDIRLGVSLSHSIDRHWMLNLGVDHTRLQGDARDSPIVREADPTTARLGVGYRF